MRMFRGVMLYLFRMSSVSGIVPSGDAFLSMVWRDLFKVAWRFFRGVL